MNILFFIAHPSQYYLFKKPAEKISEHHSVTVVYYDKEIISKLAEADPYSVKMHCIKPVKNKILPSSFRNFLEKEQKLLQIARKKKIDLFVGTSVVIAHIAKLLGAKSMIFTEDDVDVIHISAKIGYPFCNHIVSPEICNLGKWEKKVVKYNGYQKLAYLSPQHFNPKETDDLSIAKDKFYLLRFSGLNAHHDIGIKGISNEIAEKVIKILSKRGKVYISSERKLPDQFEKYRLSINPHEIHSVMAHSEMLISDSQSMSVEAAMLGIPSIRFSDFVGRISVLEELENKYQLTFGVKADDPEALYKKLFSLLDYPDLKNEFNRRRKKMLNDKIDVSTFITDLIDNYPKSVEKELAV